MEMEAICNLISSKCMHNWRVGLMEIPKSPENYTNPTQTTFNVKEILSLGASSKERYLVEAGLTI